MGLTLDPSHFHAGPNQGADFSAVFPYVRHVHLRDAGTRERSFRSRPGAVRWTSTPLCAGLHGAGYEGKFAIEYIDSIPIVAPGGRARRRALDVSANVLRMRDIFVAAERGAGIVQGMIWSPGVSRPRATSHQLWAPRTRSCLPCPGVPDQAHVPVLGLHQGLDHSQADAGAAGQVEPTTCWRAVELLPHPGLLFRRDARPPVLHLHPHGRAMTHGAYRDGPFGAYLMAFSTRLETTCTTRAPSA